MVGTLTALQHIVYLSDINRKLLNQDALLKVVDKAYKCFESCIKSHNLYEFYTHRDTLFLRINEVLTAFQTLPEVKDKFSLSVLNACLWTGVK